MSSDRGLRRFPTTPPNLPESTGELVNRGYANPFSRDLLEAVGYNKTILECGCGTGQLSHFLQLNNNHVLGVDMSISSLRLAIEHQQRNRLRRVGFCRMNIFDLAIKDDALVTQSGAHASIPVRLELLTDGPDTTNDFRVVYRNARRIVVARAGQPHQLASSGDGHPTGSATTDVRAFLGGRAFF